MLKSKTLKDAIRTKFAWPGGYEIFGVTSDGALLCCDCMRAEYRQIAYSRLHGLSDGWRVEGIDAACNLEPKDFIEEGITREGDSFGYSLNYCDHCNHVLNP